MPDQVAILLAMDPDSSLKAPFVEYSRLVLYGGAFEPIIGKELRDGEIALAFLEKTSAVQRRSPLGCSCAFAVVHGGVLNLYRRPHHLHQK